MTDQRPGASRRFTPAELDDASGIRPDELTAETRLARELESLAATTPVTMSASFADRVMASIVAEPSPAPVRSAGRAIRRASLGAFVLSIRDVWRVTFGAGFPSAVRAQALALVLVVAAAVGGTATATAAAVGLFDAPSTPPEPSLVVPDASDPSMEAPSEDATPSWSPEDGSPSLEASPSESPDASEDATNDPEGTDDNGGSDATDDHGGSSGSSGSDDDTSGSGDSGSTTAATPRPTSTPDDHEASTPKPTETPRPTQTPKPTQTADPTSTPSAGSDSSGSGSGGGDATANP